MTDAVISDRFVKEALTEALRNSLGVVNVHLFTNDVSPDRTNDSPAQFTEAAFPGYAAKNWIVSPISVGTDHHGRLVPAVMVFTPPTSGPDVNVFGFYVTYQDAPSGGTRFLMGARFTTPPRLMIVGGQPLTFNLFFEDFDAGL